MKLNKFDFGAEIISILTKGMYPDPKDALREYIQNGVDAKAKHMTVKIRQDSIVIEDDGVGMSWEEMRKAVRVGVSNKTPSKDVGFMGIGLYSSYHLCNQLLIFSHTEDHEVNQITIDFGGMKKIIEEQRLTRIRKEISGDEIMDLQSILESHITISEKGSLTVEDYPKRGTRIEISKLEPHFYTHLSNSALVATYLRNVVPLHFDKENFYYGELIENEIEEYCKKNNAEYESIMLTLQIEGETVKLFKPYLDFDFSGDIKLIEPKIFPIKLGKEFFGVAWGCLNPERKKLTNKSIRGFVLKKQGFSIGNRENLVKYFPKGNTFFDRYTGEIIIINPQLLPNASRNELEYSATRSKFYEALTNVASNFDVEANKFQEENKGEVSLAKNLDLFNQELAQFNESTTNSDVLIKSIVNLHKIEKEIESRIQRKGFSSETRQKAVELKNQVNELINLIKSKISPDKINNKKQPNRKLTIAKNIAEIGINQQTEFKNYDSLVTLLQDLEYNLDSELTELISIIDEMFVQRLATNRKEYYKLLIELRETVLNN